MFEESLFSKTLREHPDYYDEKLVKEVERLNRKIDTIELKLNSSRRNNQKLKERIKALKQINSDQEKVCKASNKEKKAQLSQIKQLKKKLEKQDEKIRILQLEKEQMKIEQKDFQNQMELKLDRAQHLNSHNSDRPSSLDVLTHTPPMDQSTRKKSGRKRGGQPGHPVHRSRLTEKPDKILTRKNVLRAPQAAVAGTDREGRLYHAVQEIDLVVSPVIRETRFYEEENGRPVAKAIMDKYKINPVVYSDHFKACVLLCNTYGALPLLRLCDIFKELIGEKNQITLSPSTITKWHKQFHNNFRKERQEVKACLLSFDLLQVDESSLKLNGKTIWVHVLCHGDTVLFYVTYKRGDWEHGPLNDLKNYYKKLVSDHFRTYQKLSVEHCECGIHLVRHLRSGVEIDHNPQCEEFIDLYLELLAKRDILYSQGETQIDPDEVKETKEKLLSLALSAVEEYEAGLREKEGKAKRIYQPDYVPTFKRFIKDPDDYLRWASDFSIPFSNNLSEHYIRIVKVKKKASGQFVSMLCAQAYVDELTCVVNARNKGESALEAIKKVFQL